MCPLRIILIFLSAALAGFFAWRSFRSAPHAIISVDPDEGGEVGEGSPSADDTTKSGPSRAVKGPESLNAQTGKGLIRKHKASEAESCMGRSTYYTERVAAIALGLLAVASPLYIDRRSSHVEPEDDDAGGASLSAWLPLMLIVLVVFINLTCFLDRRFTRFDPYWIHRVGGSSCGIMTLLLVLGFVLKCKASIGG